MAWIATMVTIFGSMYIMRQYLAWVFCDLRGCNCTEQGLWSQSSEHCELVVSRLDIASALNSSFLVLTLTYTTPFIAIRSEGSDSYLEGGSQSPV